MNKLLIFKIILVLLIIAAIVVGTLLVIKYTSRYINENNARQIVNEINERYRRN